MLHDIVSDFIIGKRVVITSATNNGSTSLALYIANTILDTDNISIYYNPSGDVDREFVKKFYPRVYRDSIWIVSPLESFLEFLQEISFSYDCLIIDPGDTLLINKDLVRTLMSMRKEKSSIILTSQIRQDPNKGWSPYSTIEKVNSFDYSIWITNVTGGNPIYKLKYIDIFNTMRSGNNFIAREIAKFTDQGNIVE